MTGNFWKLTTTLVNTFSADSYINKFFQNWTIVPPRSSHHEDIRLIMMMGVSGKKNSVFPFSTKVVHSGTHMPWIKQGCHAPKIMMSNGGMFLTMSQPCPGCRRYEYEYLNFSSTMWEPSEWNAIFAHWGKKLWGGVFLRFHPSCVVCFLKHPIIQRACR